LIQGDKSGPAREIHAGSGYWSQDAAIQVLSLEDRPTKLQVRWPGGPTTTSELPVAAREVSVEPSGKLTVAK
jgi:hypothetical protein